MAYRGKFIPTNPAKYIGKSKHPIVYRSSWERRFFRLCDTTPGVLRWVSEEIIIPYVSPLDGRIHRYFPDVWMEVQTRKGVRQLLVEIKPKSQTTMPTPRKRKTRKFLREVTTYAVNRAKWDAAEELCRQRGWEFVKVTEDEIFGHLYGK